MLILAVALVLQPDIAAFNKEFTEAVLHMDDAAILGLWEDDGVSLLPGEAPVVGKRAIAKVLERARGLAPGAKVQVQEDDCHDAELFGDFASEWCTTHQVVDLGGGKKWEGRGRMLLVLHRGQDGRWRIRREMWQST